MTVDLYKKPAYSDPLGVYNTLPLMPPFFFQGMTSRVFPLRASPFQIDVFCDTYLNFIPPELGRFRAFLPYVFLMVLDYGKLAAPVANLGWLSQYEIMFAVPVEWYKVVDGKWVFQNWTWLTPFIYVDSELSLLLGRQTYGWPKSLIRLTPSMSAWMDDPVSSVHRAGVGAQVLPEMFVGATQVPRVIMDIHQEGGLLTSQVPPDFGSSLMPWIALGNAVQTSAALMGDMVKAMTGMGITRAQPGADPANFMRMANLTAQMIDPYNPDLYFNTINLKQFRDSQKPENYCYQALTNAPMRLKQFNHGGLLGDINQMAGDASGGLRIDLYEWPGYPITETLGIEVERSWRGDGVDVSQIKPVFPFWYNVDMVYDRGENIAWRTFDGIWHGPDGAEYPPPPARRERPIDKQYNSALGVSASQTAAGVFEFTDTTMRVLPLLAEKDKLQRFLDEYLNHPMHRNTPHPIDSKFEVWGPPGEDDPHAYVYMIATTYGPMAAAEANVGAWQSESLQIMVPVRWMQKDESGNWEMRGLGLVPAYSFTDSTEAVISGSEVLGIPMTKGVFVSPPNTWMTKSVELSVNQPLLQISAEVLPAVDLGQKAEVRQIICIAQGPILPTSDVDSWDRMADSPVSPIYREQARKRDTQREKKLRDARALAIEVMGNKVAWNVFAMKQFRDVEDPETACYQSVVCIPNVIDHVYDLREIEANLNIEIREYPTLPIMRLLGLVGHLTTRQQGGGVVYKLAPVRPFWTRVKWKQERGERMWYRCGTSAWSEPSRFAAPRKGDDLPPGSYFLGTAGRPALPLRTLDRLLAKGDPTNLDVLIRSVLDEDIQDEDGAMSLDDKRAALAAIDPQMILESVLSREWENRSVGSRCHKKYQRLTDALQEAIDTSAKSREQQAVTKFFEDLRDQTVVRYDLTRGTDAHDRLMARFEEFKKHEEGFNVVERAFDDLAEHADDDKEPGEKAFDELQLIFTHLSTAFPKESQDRPESPDEKKRRRILEQRIDVLVQELVNVHVREAMTIAEAVGKQLEAKKLEAKKPVAKKPGASPAEASPALSAAAQPAGVGTQATYENAIAFLNICLQSFKEKNRRSRWKEILQLLRKERAARRDSLIRSFSKIAKKPDFCVLRDVAGPLADQIFPMDESWNSRWYVGEKMCGGEPDAFDAEGAGTFRDPTPSTSGKGG